MSAATPISTVSNQRQEGTPVASLATADVKSRGLSVLPLSLEAQGDDEHALVVACSSFNHWPVTDWAALG